MIKFQLVVKATFTCYRNGNVMFLHYA